MGLLDFDLTGLFLHCKRLESLLFAILQSGPPHSYQ